MKRPLPRKLIVQSSDRVSPSMHQVTLGGDAMQSFPPEQAGGYVKLLLDLPAEFSKPVMRTYTIRAQRSDEIDVQFALHGDHTAGPATQWALDCKVGDKILVGGPGPKKPFLPGHDYHLIAGDMAALPAIMANLETLPADAKGLAVLEIQQEGDAVEITKPAGVQIEWLLNPSPGTQTALLSSALRAHELPRGTIAGWAACEFSAMRELRTLLRDEMGLGSSSLYISSYWKLGINEAEHKQVKSDDTKAQQG